MLGRRRHPCVQFGLVARRPASGVTPGQPGRGGPLNPDAACHVHPRPRFPSRSSSPGPFPFRCRLFCLPSSAPPSPPSFPPSSFFFPSFFSLFLLFFSFFFLSFFF